MLSAEYSIDKGICSLFRAEILSAEARQNDVVTCGVMLLENPPMCDFAITTEVPRLTGAASVQAFNVGEMASMVAASSKAVVGHAQESLENAQENWSSLLAGQADVNRDGANGMGGFRLSAPVNGGLEAMLKDAEQHFGALWGSTTPESLFKVCDSP